MYHPLVVQQQRAQRLLHDKAHAVRAMRIKHAGFTALHVVARHHQHHHKIHAVAVRAFRGRPAHAIGGVDAELMGLDVPQRCWFDAGKQLAQTSQQLLPGWGCGNRRLNRVKPAFKAAMQRVVVGGLPVGAVRRWRERVGCGVLHKAGVAALAVVAAVFQVGIGRQAIPRGT